MLAFIDLYIIQNSVNILFLLYNQNKNRKQIIDVTNYDNYC